MEVTDWETDITPEASLVGAEPRAVGQAAANGSILVLRDPIASFVLDSDWRAPHVIIGATGERSGLLVISSGNLLTIDVRDDCRMDPPADSPAWAGDVSASAPVVVDIDFVQESGAQVRLERAGSLAAESIDSVRIGAFAAGNDAAVDSVSVPMSPSSSAETEVWVDGLTPGLEHTLRVQMGNPAGWGPPLALPMQVVNGTDAGSCARSLAPQPTGGRTVPWADAVWASYISNTPGGASRAAIPPPIEIEAVQIPYGETHIVVNESTTVSSLSIAVSNDTDASETTIIEVAADALLTIDVLMQPIGSIGMPCFMSPPYAPPDTAKVVVVATPAVDRAATLEYPDVPLYSGEREVSEARIKVRDAVTGQIVRTLTIPARPGTALNVNLLDLPTAVPLNVTLEWGNAAGWSPPTEPLHLEIPPPLGEQICRIHPQIQTGSAVLSCDSTPLLPWNVAAAEVLPVEQCRVSCPASRPVLVGPRAAVEAAAAVALVRGEAWAATLDGTGRGVAIPLAPSLQASAYVNVFCDDNVNEWAMWAPSGDDITRTYPMPGDNSIGCTVVSAPSPSAPTVSQCAYTVDVSVTADLALRLENGDFVRAPLAGLVNDTAKRMAFLPTTVRVFAMHSSLVGSMPEVWEGIGDALWEDDACASAGSLSRWNSSALLVLCADIQRSPYAQGGLAPSTVVFDRDGARISSSVRLVRSVPSTREAVRVRARVSMESLLREPALGDELALVAVSIYGGAVSPVPVVGVSTTTDGARLATEAGGGPPNCTTLLQTFNGGVDPSVIISPAEMHIPLHFDLGPGPNLNERLAVRCSAQADAPELAAMDVRPSPEVQVVERGTTSIDVSVEVGVRSEDRVLALSTLHEEWTVSCAFRSTNDSAQVIDASTNLTSLFPPPSLPRFAFLEPSHVYLTRVPMYWPLAADVLVRSANESVVDRPWRSVRQPVRELEADFSLAASMMRQDAALVTYSPNTLTRDESYSPTFYAGAPSLTVSISEAAQVRLLCPLPILGGNSSRGCYLPGVQVFVGHIRVPDVTVSPLGDWVEFTTPSYAELCSPSSAEMQAAGASLFPLDAVPIEALRTRDCGHHTITVQNTMMEVRAEGVSSPEAPETDVLDGNVGARPWQGYGERRQQSSSLSSSSRALDEAEGSAGVVSYWAMLCNSSSIDNSMLFDTSVIGGCAVGASEAAMRRLTSNSNGVVLDERSAVSQLTVYFVFLCDGKTEIDPQCANMATADRNRANCRFGAGGICSDCPVGAVCPGGFRALPLRGYWNDDIASSGVVRCQEPATARCLGWVQDEGAQRCGDMFTGSRCGMCKDGYHRDLAEGCKLCVNKNAVTAIMLSVAVYAGTGAGVFVFTWVLVWSLAKCLTVDVEKTRKHVIRFTVSTLLTVQTLAQVRATAEPGMPENMANVYSMLQWFELSPGVTTHPDCLHRDPVLVEFTILTASLSGMGVLIILVGLVWFLDKRRERLVAEMSAAARMKPPPLTDVTRVGQAIRLVVTGLALTYALVIGTAVSMLDCVDNEGTRVLVKNPFVHCDVGLHKDVWQIAIAALVIVGAGFPAGMCALAAWRLSVMGRALEVAGALRNDSEGRVLLHHLLDCDPDADEWYVKWLKAGVNWAKNRVRTGESVRESPRVLMDENPMLMMNPVLAAKAGQSPGAASTAAASAGTPAAAPDKKPTPRRSMFMPQLLVEPGSSESSASMSINPLASTTPRPTSQKKKKKSSRQSVYQMHRLFPYPPWAQKLIAHVHTVAFMTGREYAPHKYWMRAVDLVFMAALITTLQAQKSAEFSQDVTMSVIMASLATASLVILAVTLALLQPVRHGHLWKLPLRIGVLGITSLATVLNLLTWLKTVNTLAFDLPQVVEALSATVFILSALLFALLGVAFILVLFPELRMLPYRMWR